MASLSQFAPLRKGDEARIVGTCARATDPSSGKQLPLGLMPARIFEGVSGWAIDHAEEGNSTAGTVAGKIKNFPVVIMGTDYWDEILPFIDKMAKAGMIAPSDLELVHATNSVDDAIAHIRRQAIERFGLHPARARRHRRWLGERGLPPPLAALSNLRPPGRRT